MSEDTTEYAISVYLQPAIEQTEQKHAIHRDRPIEEVAAIMGERTCKEIIEDVCEYTFTPLDMGARTTQASSGSLTVEVLHRFMQELREEGPEPPFELFSPTEYARRRLPKMGFIPPLYTEEATRSLINDAQKTPAWIVLNARMMQLKRRNKLKRRQHRAAFRRRKRGLA